jgi:hypothetical protein
LTRWAFGPRSGPGSTSTIVSGGKVKGLAARGKLRRAGDTSKATAVENFGVRGCGRAVRWAAAGGDTVRNTNAAAASTRRTAAKMRICVNARFLLIRRRVFILLS